MHMQQVTTVGFIARLRWFENYLDLDRVHFYSEKQCSSQTACGMGSEEDQVTNFGAGNDVVGEPVFSGSGCWTESCW